MTDTTTYTCPYCRQTSTGAESSCPACGAPVDVRLRTTDSGWTELPPIVDMARIQFGQSSCQIEGRLVPVAEMLLAAGDGVYFTHNVFLWQEPTVQISTMPLAGGWKRMRAGLPLLMLHAAGPGRVALSHDSPGELVALPLQAGAAVDVREHALLAATSGVDYGWEATNVWFVTSGESGGSGSKLGLLKKGLELADVDVPGVGDVGGGDDDRPEWHYPLGQFIDRFHAPTEPGLVLVQVGGNAFVRDLAEGESILVKPPALLFKDPRVAMHLHVEYPAAGVKLWRTWGNRYLWLRLHGPGRVGLQSSYDRLEDPGREFRDVSPHTDHLWT